MLKNPDSGLYVPPKFHIPGKRKFIEGEVGFKATVSGKYHVQILHPRGTVTKPFGDDWIPNLITNTCFDQLLGGSSVSFTAIIATAMKAGTSTTTPTNSDTALNAYWAGTSTSTNSGWSTTIDTVNGASTHTVSFDWAAAGGSVGLNEVGLGAQSNNSGALYTHSLFPAQVNLSTGDILRVAYTMTFSIPSTATQIPVSLSAINGFNISGNMKTVGIFNNIFGAMGTGSISFNSMSHYLTGGGIWTLQCLLCSAPTTFPAINTVPSNTALGSGITPSAGTYTNGTFTRTLTHVWVPSNPSTTVSNVNGLFLNANFSGQYMGLYLLLSSAQTKANTNTLTVVTSCTMARA